MFLKGKRSMWHLSSRQILCPLVGLALAAVPALPSAAQVTVNVVTPGTADPWLAGMPDGSTASGGDTAPGQSPAQVTGFTINSGDHFNFAATGTTNYGGQDGPPDGIPGDNTNHAAGAENGISDSTNPVDSLIGVFLGPTQPDLNAAPAALDFTSQSSQDYLTLSPQLQQVFFIGDGMTSANVQQEVIAPTGATRLYLGMMDGSGWDNNTGSFSVDVTDLDAAPAVPEASTTVSLGLLLALGLGGLMVSARRKKDMKA